LVYPFQVYVATCLYFENDGYMYCRLLPGFGKTVVILLVQIAISEDYPDENIFIYTTSRLLVEQMRNNLLPYMKHGPKVRIDS
jgi:superfamily I DNA and RNA helicase